MIYKKQSLKLNKLKTSNLSVFEYINNRKILNIVIATHSHQIHQEITNILNTSNYEIIINEDYGSVGGDGYIYAKIK